MPQLAPLNWILLNFLFWITLITMMVLIWWIINNMYKIMLNITISKLSMNQWMW